MRGILGSIGTAALGILAGGYLLVPAAGRAESLSIQSTPILHFEPGTPSKTRFGSLEYRGAVVLTSSHGKFGGFSGMWLDATGKHLIALSDRGEWLTAEVIYDEDRPAGLTDGDIEPVLGPSGIPLSRTRQGDDESLSLKDGTAVIGIEQTQQIMRFDFGREDLVTALPKTRGALIDVPKEVRNALFAASANEGFEAVVLLDGKPGGKLLAFGEHSLDEAGNLRAWIIEDGKATSFAVKALPGDFSITDAAALPNGQLLLLERHFSFSRGLFIRLRKLSLADMRAGAVVDGPVLFEGGYSQEIDNFEAMAVHVAADGATVVTLLSDDNFNPMQRTILAQFTLLPDGGDTGSAPTP